MAVLGGNDPHSYGVTSHRASMNTLRPKSCSQLMHVLSHTKMVLSIAFVVFLQLAESKRFELLRLFRNDSLANCWFNHSPNSPILERETGIEPVTQPWQGWMLPLALHPHIILKYTTCEKGTKRVQQCISK